MNYKMSKGVKLQSLNSTEIGGKRGKTCYTCETYNNIITF